QMKELGAQTDMTMALAVKMEETGETFHFAFNKGKIDAVDESEDVEFLITAPEKVWRLVFHQEIDPFVATTQKKMHLKGDFARISKWYAPCSRVFELWTQVPVE
ncbi:MAG: SCP2 sterol-binding domain-containing protein, partial [Candidatus Omnitrophica bacterium]|nr:SCP2 sterol-binding domain-containing protein [Candidatus Omnitrophota bacterium]